MCSFDSHCFFVVTRPKPGFCQMCSFDPHCFDTHCTFVKCVDQAWILKSEGKRHYVTYKNWPSNYNEWISKEAVITEAQAKRMLAKQKKGENSRGSSAYVKAYELMDNSRELSNKLHQETQQQYRDTERYYGERRYR